MKIKEIQNNEELLFNGHIICIYMEGNKIKPRYIRKHDGKTKKSKPVIIPTEAEIKKYALDNGYDPNFMWEKAKGYIDAGMRDSQDNPVKNLKLKLNQIWFKPEHKLKETANSFEFKE